MRAKRLMLTAAGALFAAAIAGGIAYATIPNDSKVFTACMLNKVGTIRLIDKTLPTNNPMSHCSPVETEVSWNQKGQPGLAGAAGKDGADGKAGTDGRDGRDGQAGSPGPKGDPCLASDPACVGPKVRQGRSRGPWAERHRSRRPVGGVERDERRLVRGRVHRMAQLRRRVPRALHRPVRCYIQHVRMR